MNLNLTDQELEFRDEVRRFLRSAIPTRICEKMRACEHLGKSEYVEWTRILFDRGWAVPHWPREWGGTGWTPMQLCIFRNEIQQVPAPEPLSFGVNYVGPVIYTFGNEEQKRRFLPRIARLDDWWCQGFSEPGAGSDLAALRTTAQRDGEVYLVDGQKTWTTLAQHANWIFCLVRTNPDAKKQRGISFLLIDMKSPGISVRPITTIDGGCEINEIFFDSVRVPVSNLVGEENRGWDYAKFLLGNERTGVARVGLSRARLRRIREIATRTGERNRPAIYSPALMEKISLLECELRAIEIMEYRVLAQERDMPRGQPNPLSSVLKLRGSEIQQATSEILMEIVGPMSNIVTEDAAILERALLDGIRSEASRSYFNWRKVSIYGGSNEIQKNIIAKGILGL